MQRIRSQFFSSVAHELRTPLNTVIPMVSLVLSLLPKTDPLYERVRKLLSIVHSSSIHLQSVIEDALDISRIENNKFKLFKQYFDIRQALNEVIDIMNFQLEQKSLTHALLVEEHVPRLIFSDQKRLKQVLFNLIGNAIKFTISGSVRIIVGYENQALKI